MGWTMINGFGNELKPLKVKAQIKGLIDWSEVVRGITEEYTYQKS